MGDDTYELPDGGNGADAPQESQGQRPKRQVAPLAVAFLPPPETPEPVGRSEGRRGRDKFADVTDDTDSGADVPSDDDRASRRVPAASRPASERQSSPREAPEGRRAAESRPTREADGASDAAPGENPADGAGEAGEGLDEESAARRRRKRGRRGRGAGTGADDSTSETGSDESPATASEGGANAARESSGTASDQGGRSKGADGGAPDGDVEGDAGTDSGTDAGSGAGSGADEDCGTADDESGTSSRRRRRRRSRPGGEGDQSEGTGSAEQGAEPEIQGVKGSTRLEARRQRRRDGRSQTRRAPVLSEAEFLSRRESVDRVMAVRERNGRTQIAVLEDGVLVEHYVAAAGTSSMVGSVYLGRVQNVLPSMEAAFIDVGRGRNAVLYAGEVNWDASGLEGKPRLIEHALSPGQLVPVQVTKEPMGTKGARLTSQISLPGRYVVYVPDGSLTGISRKLPDAERSRLREILGRIVPENAGVIVRTAAEGATEEDLTRDIARLTAQWDAILAQQAKATGPTQLYEEPDVLLRVVRDLFNEDFSQLVVEGSGAWEMVHGYVSHVAPELLERVTEHGSDPATDPDAGPESAASGDVDLFAALRIDEQIRKALDRKVWLPSGGYLIIDRTEAMTVVDVNTGKFTGQGGNLEETVTRNNLEAAEEIVRQLRLRDVGGIVVIDFIDMVLSSNRDLVLRRLIECLGRDRTRHQVAEVTSLGLVQMTRKRVAAGLVEAFSETCDCCKGRGIVIHDEPLTGRSGGGSNGSGGSGSGNGGGGRSRGKSGPGPNQVAAATQASRGGARKGRKRPVGVADDTAGEGGRTGGTGGVAEPVETPADQPAVTPAQSGDTAGTAGEPDVSATDEVERDTEPSRPPARRSSRGGRRRKPADTETPQTETPQTETPPAEAPVGDAVV